MLIFDIETNGLLHELDRIHVLCIKDVATGEVARYSHQPGAASVIEGLKRLAVADQVSGHNVIKFDVPAIQKVYPWFHIDKRRVVDTMVLARLTYPDLSEIDTKLKLRGLLPGKLFGKHSLEAWGHRLGNYKGDFKGPWATWTQEMEDYCVQDVHVTGDLLARLEASKVRPDGQAVDLEHQVAWIIARQERYGFRFDVKKGEALYVTLAKKRVELEGRLQSVFPPFYLREKEFTPKRDNAKQGYVAGATFTKVGLTMFNPSSRHHIANRLKARYGWKPDEYTPTGEPKVDETILASMPFPEAKLLAEYFLVDKRVGQLAVGKEAWLKHVGADGRIHGGVNTNGAVTGRMTHMYPNIAQTPASYSPYGKECRELFHAGPGKVLVGADADALELRCLAHFMARFDGGDYVRAVDAGKKAEGTDAHSVNARAIGLDPRALVHGKETGRDVSKTWFYAFIYGAGDVKLGLILTRVKNEKRQRAAGKRSRASLLENLPALRALTESVKGRARKTGGYLRGLDGRVLKVRSEHAALNTLLQSAGAVLMKRALVILDNNLMEKGYAPGKHYEFVANVHDEWQIECDESIAAVVAAEAPAAIRAAGESFGFRCPLAGDARIGRSWADTH